MPDLAPAARRVIRFIDDNRAKALASSAMEIAAQVGTSDATVVRAAQSLGFTGLAGLKQALAAAIDRPTPADDMRHTLAEVGESAARAVDVVLDAHREALANLATPEAKERIAAAVSLLHGAGRIAIFGIGPSAALAHYAAVPLGRTGRRTLILDRTGRMLADQLLDLRPEDALLALTYGRPYREVLTVFSEARRLGLPTVLLTSDPNHKLGSMADVVLVVARGRAGQVALHGATLVAIEAIVLGLASAFGGEALAVLDRLTALREAVGERRRGES